MPELTRREALTSGARLRRHRVPGRGPERVVKNGRLKQSVSRWCYRDITLPKLCEAAAGIRDNQAWIAHYTPAACQAGTSRTIPRS